MIIKIIIAILFLCCTTLSGGREDPRGEVEAFIMKGNSRVYVVTRTTRGHGEVNTRKYEVGKKMLREDSSSGSSSSTSGSSSEKSSSSESSSSEEPAQVTKSAQHLHVEGMLIKIMNFLFRPSNVIQEPKRITTTAATVASSSESGENEDSSPPGDEDEDEEVAENDEGR